MLLLPFPTWTFWQSGQFRISNLNEELIRFSMFVLQDEACGDLFGVGHKMSLRAV